MEVDGILTYVCIVSNTSIELCTVIFQCHAVLSEPDSIGPQPHRGGGVVQFHRLHIPIWDPTPVAQISYLVGGCVRRGMREGKGGSEEDERREGREEGRQEEGREEREQEGREEGKGREKVVSDGVRKRHRNGVEVVTQGMRDSSVGVVMMYLLSPAVESNQGVQSMVWSFHSDCISNLKGEGWEQAGKEKGEVEGSFRRVHKWLTN